MPRKKTGQRKTPEPLVPLASDGLHYVRPASIKDRHPMRFVVDQYRLDGLPNNQSLPRHVETAERGIELMQQFTAKACKANPKLKQALILAGETQDIQPIREARRKKTAKKVSFPTTRFVCIMANPVAQVWLCTKHKAEVATIGRRSGGHPPRPDKLPHLPGELAVLVGDTPQLDHTGQVRVFTVRKAAEDMARILYVETPADQKLSDNNDPEHPTTTVYQNMTHSVHFDPVNNGGSLPFNIYNHRVHRPVLHTRGDYPLKFRSITGAVKEADRLDKQARGAL